MVGVTRATSIRWPSSSEARALRLRALAPESAEIETALSRRAKPLVVEAEGVAARIRLADAIAPKADAPWLSATIDGAAAAFNLSWGDVRRGAGEPIEGANAADGAMALEGALAPWLDALEAATGLSLRLINLGAGAPDFAHPAIARGVIVERLGVDGAAASIARLPTLLSLDAAEALAKALAARSDPRADLEPLRLPCVWEADALTLSRGALAGLRPGGAVLLSTEPAGGWLALGARWSAPGRAATGGVELVGPFRPTSERSRGEPHMAEEPQTPAAPGAPAQAARLDDVEIRVSFRAGEAHLTLEELRTLGPGAVIPLAQSSAPTVDILANGAVIGAGELVTLGDQRAVQIKTLFSDE